MTPAISLGCVRDRDIRVGNGDTRTRHPHLSVERTCIHGPLRFLRSGMEQGLNESYAALDRLLVKLS
jgi:hypothetical protein